MMSVMSILGICISLLDIIIIIGRFENIILGYDQFILHTLEEHICMTFINNTFHVVTTINSYNN